MFFFFNDTATPEIYTLSLHDALPISYLRSGAPGLVLRPGTPEEVAEALAFARRQPVPLSVRSGGHGISGRSTKDRKSTRLNSSHSQISYAVFCLKKNNAADRPTSSAP